MHLMILMDNLHGEAKVVGQNIDAGEKQVGARNSNHILNSIDYTVEFYDETLCNYVANMINQNVYVQVVGEGRENIFMSEKIYRQINNPAVNMQYGLITFVSNKIRYKTIKGWQLLVIQMGESCTCESFKDIKKSNPTKLA